MKKSNVLMETTFQSPEIEEISEHYHVIKRLGEGTFGQVLLAQDKTRGEKVAVKLLKKDRTELETFLREQSLSFFLSEHPNVITTHSSIIVTANYYGMTMELARAGTLHDIIKAEVGIPEEAVKRCAVQISSALGFMHKRGLVHRDIKTDNILIMDEDCYHVMLSDFGMTRYVGTHVPTMSGTIPYMSPELCDSRPGNYLVLDPSIDAWAFGVLLFVLLTGQVPWQVATDENFRYLVYLCWQQNLSFRPPPLHWSKITREAISMISNLFTRDPSSRHSVLSVLNYLNSTWKVDNLGSNQIVETEDEILVVD